VSIYRVDYYPKDIGVFTILKSAYSIIKISSLVSSIVKYDNIRLIVFGNGGFLNLFLNMVIKYYLNIKTAIIFHGEDVPVVQLKLNSFRRWLIKRADFYLCNSEFTKGRLLGFCGESENIFVAYPGVEDKFFTQTDIISIRDKYDVKNKRIIYTVGRLDPRKGHALIIQSLSLVLKLFPDVVYLIGGSGNYMESLEKLVFELNLQKYVIFCGDIPAEEIVSFHKISDIFVMPNQILEDGDTEGFGIVFLEANASGKPVIGGACGGALDAIEDGLSGYLIDPQNAKALAETIIYLLSHPEHAERMGQYGRMRAWNIFRWPYLADKLNVFFHQLNL